MEPENDIQSYTMTKKDLVNLVSEKLGFTQSDVGKTIDTALDIIVNHLGKGKRWEIRNFGVFEVKKRAPRKGRNPKTGELVEVPNRYVVTFKAGKELKLLIKQLSSKLNK